MGTIPAANVLQLPLSVVAKSSSAIFAAGQTRQAKASGNVSVLAVWLPLEMRKMGRDEMLCSLYTIAAVKKKKKMFEYLPFLPKRRKYIFITACKP